MSLEETPSTISENWIYTKDVFLEKTLSTIPQNPICIKNCGNDFKAKDVSLQHKFKIFHNRKFRIYVEEMLWKILNLCWRETYLVLKSFPQFLIHIGFYGIVESVFSRDTFSIYQNLLNCGKCLFKWYLLYKLKFLRIVESVSSRDIFNFKITRHSNLSNCGRCLLKDIFNAYWIFCHVEIVFSRDTFNINLIF